MWAALRTVPSTTLTPNFSKWWQNGSLGQSRLVSWRSNKQRPRYWNAACYLAGYLSAAGLEFATRYLTPEEPVGGDWYDVFTVPSGDLWVVAGDVAGHGLHAAVVMGRVRSALRSYALLSSDPAEVLELTSRKVQHFEIETMVTAVCATASFPYHGFRVATAGHPPPLLVPMDGPAYFLATAD